MQFTVFTSMFVNRYNVKSGKCDAQNNIKRDTDVIDVEIINTHTSHK